METPYGKRVVARIHRVFPSEAPVNMRESESARYERSDWIKKTETIALPLNARGKGVAAPLRGVGQSPTSTGWLHPQRLSSLRHQPERPLRALFDLGAVEELA